MYSTYASSTDGENRVAFSQRRNVRTAAPTELTQLWEKAPR